MASFSLKVNGRTQAVEADPDCPLLYVLQEDLRLNGPKFGCGLAQCGACTVLMNGEPIRSCTTPMSEVNGEIT
ncbi:MAG: 2Fe-2S iron-sulfur cluster binding domain-containing protein, partial [Bryobacteraceae bacterium]|nr:2Fe-2S iron-sulfur cluster binding domain-containing protein [Bryobacteraceae bacterium]